MNYLPVLLAGFLVMSTGLVCLDARADNSKKDATHFELSSYSIAGSGQNINSKTCSLVLANIRNMIVGQFGGNSLEAKAAMLLTCKPGSSPPEEKCQ